MSKVIKNNDGVAVVEGPPAASLVKDVDKFFTAKPPKRMAGEAIKPQKLDTERLSSEKLTEPMPVIENLEEEESKFAEPAMKTNVKEKTPQETESKREKAVNKTREFKRQRFVDRSVGEQAATQGSFITTLQT